MIEVASFCFLFLFVFLSVLHPAGLLTMMIFHLILGWEHVDCGLALGIGLFLALFWEEVIYHHLSLV